MENMHIFVSTETAIGLCNDKYYLSTSHTKNKPLHNKRINVIACAKTLILCNFTNKIYLCLLYNSPNF
jgi:hypothetical protein